MAKNKQQMIFEVDGDVTGLRKALATGTNSLQQFGKESDELFGGFTNQFTELAERFKGFNTGIVGIAGAAGLLAGGIFTAIDASNEYVKVYNEVSKASGLTVTELQQLQKTFNGVGFDVEKFGDLNRDVLDHLGDAFRDGSGPAEDMKAYGINIQNFNKYLNQSDGGIRALAEAFYEMRKSGKSIAEITNMMETLGSDGAKLVSTFEQYSNVTDLMNAVQSQHAILTDDVAKKYQDFDTKVSQLSSTFQLWKAEALGPTLDDIQTLFNLMNKEWTKTDFWEMFNNFYYGGDGKLAKWTAQIDGVNRALIKNTQEWRDAQNANNFPPKPTANDQPAPTGGWVNKDKEAAKAKAAADKAAAAAKQAEAKRIQAQKNLEQAISQIGLSEGDIRIKTFQRQQDEIVQKIKASSKTLKLTEAQTTSYLTQAYDSRTKKFKDMIDEMISYSDPNKGLRELSQNIAAISGSLTNSQAEMLLRQQNQRVGLEGQGTNENNPFDNQQELKQKQEDLQNQMQLELTLNGQLNEKLGTSHEEYLKRKQAITEKYNQKSLAIEAENTQAQLQILSDSAGSIGTIMAGAFGEGSKAAQAAFAIQKGISIANTVMKIQEALATALATPFPMNIANYGQILSLGASIITTAKGAAQGQAHSGIDAVPTMGGKDESTWILQAGERVLSKNNNRDLTNFLSNQNSNGSGNGSTSPTINAPLIIQGQSNMSDAQVNAMLQKHQNSVLQAVRSAQKRNT
ncbi:hypothetical protein IAQ00_13650 [Pantoea ananatis]|uniref:hypothetical protein n=1 Tax=Pantoea ananas TaxID=553 RepID=UPI002079545F|nr:hypothetical protein [Pantoea ananatis]USL56758.1 hypothetical protein IAQ00_13650 [Pantoea ananatis]